MKLYKLFLFILAAAVMTACSDDEMKVNTAQGVTVEFGADSLITQEGLSIARIPVVLHGTPNGKVVVKIDIKEGVDAENPGAMEDVHFYASSKTITLIPELGEAYFEIAPVDDSEQNLARTFIVTIASVEGAELGARSQAVGYIRDNDTEPYDRLTGNWNLVCVEDGAEISVPFVMTNFQPGDFRYERLLSATGDWLGVGLSDTLDVQFNKAGNFVKIMAGSVLAGPLNFGGIGAANVVSAVPGGSMPSLTGGIEGNWNADFTEVTFSPQEQLLLAVVTTSDNTTVGGNILAGTYTSWTDIRFVRSEE